MPTSRSWTTRFGGESEGALVLGFEWKDPYLGKSFSAGQLEAMIVHQKQPS